MEELDTHSPLSPNTVIKHEVADNVSLQANQPKAMSLGIDRQKAFDEKDSDSRDNDRQLISHVEHRVGPPDRTIKPNMESHEQEIEDEASPPSDAAIEVASTPSSAAAPPSKKRKSKKKSKTQRQASGFEEYYVDSPLTPQQHSEELDLYDLQVMNRFHKTNTDAIRSRPFMERIEIAVQRYTAKRNIDSDRKNLFDKYLKFGGIDSGPKMFSGGLDAATLADSSATEIAMLRAQHFVPIDRAEDSVVDFETCLRAFLYTVSLTLQTGADIHRSSSVIFTFDLNQKASVQRYIGVIKNFLNYLLHHDVCPEYKEQIVAAQLICAQAHEEIWSIVQAQPLLPGSFNVACSELFGGMYQGTNDPACGEWMDEADKSRGSIGFPHDKAGKIFTMGFAAYGSEGQMEKYKEAKRIERVKKANPYRPKPSEMDLRITEIELGRSNPEISALYQSERAKGLPILGILKTKTWDSPVAMAQDLTPKEEEILMSKSEQFREMEFWIDDKLLEKLHVGMCLEATVKELAFGVFYFDAVQTLRPSFFTFLPNEQVLDWRKVEREWLPPKIKEEDQHTQE